MSDTYTVIEDCSPYYIRFIHNNISEFIDYTLDIFTQRDWPELSGNNVPNFRHYRLSNEIGAEVLARTPVHNTIVLQNNRVSYFKSLPGCYYGAHKDGGHKDFGGAPHRFSINYTATILDDKCITSWYSDDDLRSYQLDEKKLSIVRKIVEFDKTKPKHTPLKSMTAKPGECILFNTDIFHDWDNSQSTNERIIITLRPTTPSDFYFEDAKKLLFG